MTIRIGDTFTSNNFGRYRVGKFDGPDHAWIVFENTGHVERPSIRSIIANGVIDYKGPYHVKVGGLYNTNNYGKVRVVQIVNTKDITVEFVNTGNRVKSQKNTILAGLLTDKTAIALEGKARLEREAEERRLEQEAKLAEKEALKEANRLAVLERQQQREAERLALKAFQRTLDSRGNVFIGTQHEDNLGMKFEVVGRVDGNSQWVVKYLESGNEYNYSELQIVRKTAADKKLDNYFDLKAAYDKKCAALWYQENREQALKKACDYQRNNLERSRVNNQNRRSRRKGADGRHTLEEISRLLEEQDHKCVCCNVKLTDANKHLDHIYPLALGGTNYIWNLQWMCQFCNNSKSDSHPDDWEIYSKSEHFRGILQARAASLQ